MADTILRSKYRAAIHKWIKKMKRREAVPANKRDAVKAGLRLPFVEIGCGSRRIVYDLNNGYILKVAIIKEGIQSCQNEVDFYGMAFSSLKRHLAKIKEFGEGWVVMKKAGRMLADHRENRKKVLRVYIKFKKIGILAEDIIDLTTEEPRWHNIRYRRRDDSVVIIDYGDFRTSG